MALIRKWSYHFFEWLFREDDCRAERWEDSDWNAAKCGPVCEPCPPSHYWADLCRETVWGHQPGGFHHQGRECRTYRGDCEYLETEMMICGSCCWLHGLFFFWCRTGRRRMNCRWPKWVSKRFSRPSVSSRRRSRRGRRSAPNASRSSACSATQQTFPMMTASKILGPHFLQFDRVFSHFVLCAWRNTTLLWFCNEVFDQRPDSKIQTMKFGPMLDQKK